MVIVNGIITRGFEHGIITRGFGKIAEVFVVYKVISVCEPNIISHEYGRRYIKAKELKPIMRTKTPLYIYEEIDE